MITERGWLPQLRPKVNIYVITGTDGLIFDAGYGNRGAVKLFVKQFHRIEKICRDRCQPCSVRRILISHAHPDHFSGLRRIRKELGLSIVLTRPMAELIGRRRVYRALYNSRRIENALLGRSLIKRAMIAATAPLTSLGYELLYGTSFIPDPDQIIDEEGDIGINGERWSIFLSPGHSAEHISLYDPSRGVLLAGDNVLEKIITWLGPPRSDPAVYVQSLEKYLALPKLDIILGSHGMPVRQPARRINSIISWRKKRTGDVLSIVRKAGPAGVTAREILKRLYRRGGTVLMMMAEGWVLLVLQNLLEDGTILSYSAGGNVYFYARQIHVS